MSTTDQHIILFDGVCNLCNKAVQFVLKHDKKEIFRFASLQSATGKELMQQSLTPAQQQEDSIVYIHDGKGYTKSGAALRIARQLGGAWVLLYAFIIIPPFIRNAVYSLIATNRYRMFGKQESCWLPLPKWKARFLE